VFTSTSEIIVDIINDSNKSEIDIAMAIVRCSTERMFTRRSRSLRRSATKYSFDLMTERDEYKMKKSFSDKIIDNIKNKMEKYIDFNVISDRIRVTITKEGLSMCNKINEFNSL